MSTPRVLYLEDDEFDVTLLREALVAEGIVAELLHVRTPLDFSTALKSSVPDLILFDGKVAGFGGMAALHMARASCPIAPSFCLTGLVIEEKAAEMRSAGAAGCLSKQDLTAVSVTIRQVLQNPRDQTGTPTARRPE
mgnify:CR=1 FL=1